MCGHFSSLLHMLAYIFLMQHFHFEFFNLFLVYLLIPTVSIKSVHCSSLRFWIYGWRSNFTVLNLRLEVYLISGSRTAY